VIALLIYAVWCVVFARINARWIAAGKRIRHGWNGLMHIAAAVIVWLIYRDWKLVAALLIMTRLVFDTALNLWRGLPVDYVPTSPKSWVDKAEIAVFNRNGWLPKVLYLVAIVVLLIIRIVLPLFLRFTL